MVRWFWLFVGGALILSATLISPRPLAAAEEIRAQSRVAAALLNVRSGPDTSFAVLTTVAQGAPVTVTGRGDDCTWLYVELADGMSGWVSGPQLGSALECGDLPVIPVQASAQKSSSAQGLASAGAPVAAAQSAAAAQPPPVDCTLAGEDYGALTIDSPPTAQAAANHADLNPTLRGVQLSTTAPELHQRYPMGDPLAPQLTALFADHRAPAVTAAYQVFDWDWACNCRGQLLTEPEVTALGVAVAPGEVLYTPSSQRTIGDDYEVLVLYATANQITLKFTREDNVIHGYTLHVNDICVEPSLLALYQSMDAAGRSRLPALRSAQPFGRSTSNAIQIAIRDNGQFMDPRSRTDWWR